MNCLSFRQRSLSYEIAYSSTISPLFLQIAKLRLRSAKTVFPTSFRIACCDTRLNSLQHHNQQQQSSACSFPSVLSLFCDCSVTVCPVTKPHKIKSNPQSQKPKPQTTKRPPKPQHGHWPDVLQLQPASPGPTSSSDPTLTRNPHSLFSPSHTLLSLSNTILSHSLPKAKRLLLLQQPAASQQLLRSSVGNPQAALL
jgi:hypothetical protein